MKRIITTLIAAAAIATSQAESDEELLARFYRDAAALEKAHPELAKKPEPETMAQKNAVKMAEEYLESQPFSRRGLIEQLISEGFSRKDSVYGVDNAGYEE